MGATNTELSSVTLIIIYILAHPFRVHLHKCIKDCNVIMSVWPQPEIWPECTAEKLSAHQGHHLIFLNTEGEPVCATRPKKGKRKYSANSITLAAFTFLVTSQSPQLFHKLSYKKMEGKQESTSLHYILGKSDQHSLWLYGFLPQYSTFVPQSKGELVLLIGHG